MTHVKSIKRIERALRGNSKISEVELTEIFRFTQELKRNVAFLGSYQIAIFNDLQKLLTKEFDELHESHKINAKSGNELKEKALLLADYLEKKSTFAPKTSFLKRIFLNK